MRSTHILGHDHFEVHLSWCMSWSFNSPEDPSIWGYHHSDKYDLYVSMLPGHYGKTAIHSISTAAFRGSAATCTHVRAGIALGLKYYTWSWGLCTHRSSALTSWYISFNASKSSKFVMNMLALTMPSKVVPAALRTFLIFSRAARWVNLTQTHANDRENLTVSTLIPPSHSLRLWSCPTVPETNTKPFETIAWAVGDGVLIHLLYLLFKTTNNIQAKVDSLRARIPFA